MPCLTSEEEPFDFYREACMPCLTSEEEPLDLYREACMPALQLRKKRSTLEGYEQHYLEERLTRTGFY